MGYTNVYLVKKYPFLFPKSFYKGFENQAGRFLKSQHILILIASMNIIGNSGMKTRSTSWFPVGCQVCIEL